MALSPSHHGKDMQDLIKEGAPAAAALMEFCEDLSVPQKEDPVCVAGCKSVMCYHENGCSHLLIDTLNRGQKHLRGMAV